MKKFISIISLFIFIKFGYSQPQNYTWPLPTNSGPSQFWDFNTSTLQPLPTADPDGVTYTEVEWSEGGYVPSAVGHHGAANAISDPDGNLLFFIIGPNIFDKDGRTIYNNILNDNIEEASQGFAEIMVVPDPGNCERYYLFTEAYTGSSWYGTSSVETTPKYAVLDISENQSNPLFNENARGNLVVPFTSLLPIFGLPESYASHTESISWAASNLDANGERAIICYSVTGGHRLMKMKLTDTGLIPYGSYDIATDLGLVRPVKVRTELELVTLPGGNYRISSASVNHLYVLDLNPNTLEYIPGSIKEKQIGGGGTYAANPAGIEFTPDGKYVYVTHQSTDILPNVIDCYDVTADAWVNLPVWADILNLQHQFSFIEIGPNGDMYMATANHLAKISNPSTPLTSTFDATFQDINYDYNYWHPLDTDPFLKRYTLPDQIDGMDYSAHFSAAPECCITGRGYDVDMFTASLDWTGGANQLWTPTSNPINSGMGADVFIRGEVRIPANINVTISGMNFYFHPDARVVVERSDIATLPNGAKLVLKDSTVLTVDNRCGDNFMWQGVEVQGWRNQSQLPIFNSCQGFLLMLADTRIEHALIGAKANGSASNNKGGIIQANGATFFNNRVDVQFYDYNNFYGFAAMDNLSSFRACNFVTDSLLNIPTYIPRYHAEIRRCNGVKFYGNTFVNETPSLFTETTLGYGIMNLHSKLTVEPNCTSMSIPCAPGSLVPNTFKSLNYGVYCATSTSMQAIKIDQNEFIDNMRGVFISNFDFPTITRNNFQIATSVITDSILGRTYGIYLAGSSGFKVEENDLREYDDPSAVTGLTRGIIVSNSGNGELVPLTGNYHNEIYKNTFTDLLVGGQSQYINSTNHFASPEQKVGGLQWLCNVFNTNINADLYVPTGRINYLQGSFVSPSGPDAAIAPFAGARNLFSQTTGGVEIEVGPFVQSSDYHHYYNSLTDPIDYSDPLYTKTLIPMTINYNTSCPSKIPTGGIIVGGSYEVYLKDTIGELEESIAAKLAQIDNNNTSGLLYLIDNGTDLAIRTNLVNASPYLSDSVLIAYMNSSPPNSYLRTVLLANSPLSDSAWAVFDSLAVPAPLKADVLAAQTGVSAMQALQNTIHLLSANREFYFDETIRYYLNDTIASNSMDSIISLLQDETSLTRKQQLCDAYLAIGDTSSAENVRTQILAITGTTSYTQVAEINIANYSKTMDVINADSLLMLTLQNIAVDTSYRKDATRAQALLFEYVYAADVLHWVEPLYINGQNRMSKKDGQANQQFENNEPAVVIYPNPAADQLTIILEGIEELKSIQIDFFNVMGQKIITVPLADYQVGIKVDVSTIPAGIYLVSVRSEQGVFSTTRVVVE